MKKILSLLLLSVLLVSLFSCGGSEKKAEAYLGLGYSVFHDGSNATAGSRGAASIVMIGAAAVVDPDGKVIDVALDAAVTAARFDNLGAVADGDAQSTNSMASMSNSGFDTVVTKVAAAVIGKTESEIRALITSDTSEDEVAMYNAVAYAVKTAKSPCGKSDKPGVALSGKMTVKSADFLTEANGSVSVEINFASVALDADGKVSGAALDVITLARAFNASGELVEPATAETKREKKYDYGMKPASKIELEWFEQAENFCEYLRGKTSTEIGSIGVANGYPTEDALLSGCTMGISGYITVAVAAVAAAN